MSAAPSAGALRANAARMMPRSLGLLVVLIGVAVIIIGLLLMTGALSWFGRLPGDLRVERESVRIYVPLASMLVLSLLASALLWVLRRFF